MLAIALTMEVIKKFFRFAIVGVSGTLIDFGITYMSKEIFKTSKYLANALGFFIAASSNYYLNRIWTFGSHDANMGTEYIRFFIVALIGLAINTGIIYIVHQRMKHNFYVGKVVATGIVLFWNFIGNAIFTFATK